MVKDLKKGSKGTLNLDCPKNIYSAINSNTKNVLEIGPGMGVLTKFLVKNDYKTEVVEIDTESVFYLRLNYPELEINCFSFLIQCWQQVILQLLQ